MKSAKVKAVSDYPVPENGKDVRAFLGLTGFCQRTIDNYA